MANSTSAININVPSDVKDEANKIFSGLGLNMSTAVNIFLKRAIYERGIPFEVKEPKPSNKFLEALRELEYMETHPDKYKTYNNMSELKEALLSDDEL